MKVYHGTNLENENSILVSGLWPVNTNEPTRYCGSKTGTLQGDGLTGIYVWTTLEAAVMWSQLCAEDVDAIFEVEVSGAFVSDPEFDDIDGLAGKALFLVTDEPVGAELVWTAYD